MPQDGTVQLFMLLAGKISISESLVHATAMIAKPQYEDKFQELQKFLRALLVAGLVDELILTCRYPCP